MSAKEKLVVGAALAIGSTALAAIGAALLEPVVMLLGTVAGVAATAAIFSGFRSVKADQHERFRSARPMEKKDRLTVAAVILFISAASSGLGVGILESADPTMGMVLLIAGCILGVVGITLMEERNS